ncbi:MAG: hypothetical protein FJX74_02980, partial [Armatimonadetes bacterium]|nr:hypothetical protein [Armatimonadota bacterium]
MRSGAQSQAVIGTALVALVWVGAPAPADEPTAGVYVGLDEHTGIGLTVTLSERPNGRFQVAGTAQGVDSGESRPVTGTYY